MTIRIILLVGASLVFAGGTVLSEPPAPSNNSIPITAGTWEDDAHNWYRAFQKEQPTEISVIHSKYWRSDHWTDEYAYYFEVKATPEWRDTFLKTRNAQPVPADKARSFRTQNRMKLTPDWFAPDPVSDYEVWDERPGYFGTIWINRESGHIHFWGHKF